MERRIITTDATEEDERIENTLRPQCLKDYVGQEKLKSTLNIYKQLKTVGMHWIMCCFTARPVLEKRPWRGSLPMKWEPG